MRKTKPVIGITVGDPAGIGPEITIKSLINKEIYEICNPVIIGNFEILLKTVNDIAPDMSLIQYDFKNEDKGIKNNSNSIKVIDIDDKQEDLFKIGKISAASGKYMYRCIKKCFELIARKKINGFVNGPITKESLSKARLGYNSEFDIFADLSNVKEVGSVVKWRSVIFASVVGHFPFREIINQLTLPRITSTSKLLYQTMIDFGIQKPKIAIAALNPHAGEDGLFGDEEEKIIRPAIEKLKKNNINIKGYFPADTIFLKTLKGELDGIVFLYHDQCNLAIKTAAFNQGLVVVYRGLPQIITSPCHGSALEIAGQNKANPRDMFEAIKTITYLASNT